MPWLDYPLLEADIARARIRFLAPSADKQTRNYDTECSNLYLYILYIYIYIYIIYIDRHRYKYMML